tara:strand:+ start:1019 stop:1180 length:162 start_codon:yes stop_codon:yes gene_type:complete
VSGHAVLIIIGIVSASHPIRLLDSPFDRLRVTSDRVAYLVVLIFNLVFQKALV